MEALAIPNVYFERNSTAWLIDTHVFFLLTQDFGDCRIKLGWHWMISILRAMYHNVSPIQLCLAFFSPFILFLSLCFGLRCLSVVSGLGEASVLHQYLPGDIATPCFWSTIRNWFFPLRLLCLLALFSPAQLPGTLAACPSLRVSTHG